MARNPRWLLFSGVLSLYLCLTLLCNGFNIDDRFPVIKEGKTIGSFFGFSVALHKQTVGSVKYLLLTGAPKEKASMKDVNETGAVYSCPITTGTADCSRMDLVTSTTPSTEMVEGMWLGVTVASQKDLADGRVLACGHRYTKIYQSGANEQRSMVGKCFVRGNDLSFDSNDKWQDSEYEFCNPNSEVELEGMCNMGISGGITESDVYTGSPGSFTWQGNVHITWMNPDPDNVWDTNNKEFGQLNNRYSYMGYATLEEKKLLSPDVHTVVTGSPRDKAKGSVMLGRKDNLNIQSVLVIPGKQVGSYFGGSLAVTDLNNDGWNDLIVGAPFYFDRSKDQGGAVYVYMNENGSFRKEPVVLTGPVNSAFGLSLAAIGDINQDGFQDFAVGAPFHETGKVYIWMGSMKGILDQYSQVIEGKSVGDGKFKTFGYSLNGGMDMDDNSYPDLLVGSLDDRIALLRTRPVIHLRIKEFTMNPNIVDPKKCPADSKACIRAKVCFTYTLSNGKEDLKKNIVVNFTVEADIERESSRRVNFRSNKNAPGLKDKLKPVVFELRMALQEQKPDNQGLQNLDTFPILNLLPEGVWEGLDQVLQYNRNVKKVVIIVEVTNLPTLGRLAEDAHQALLNVPIPKTLSYSGFRVMEGNDVTCQLTEDSVSCELGNPLSSNERVKLRLIFETGDINLNTPKIESLLQLSTLSEQDDLVPVPVVLLVEMFIRTTFTVDPPHVQTYFSGEVMGESAMVKTSDVGSLVEYTFNVIAETSMGPMGTLAIEFEWPIEVENGKWLLYLTEIIMNGTSQKHCVPPGDIVNLLNLTLTEGNGSRRARREAVVAGEPRSPAVEPQAAVTLLSSRKNVVQLECSTGAARCVTFTCPLLDMQSRAQVVVRARVWNSTLLEATLKLITDKPSIRMESETRDFTVDIDGVLQVEAPYEIPLWIVLLAVGAGLVLWKCGFFKRASRMERFEAETQKAEMKIQPSETEKLNEDC
ncbi:hypothetical protein NHX12_025160 [Muraenolepis orangiensis]|uniref:Integrin alpha-2 domain-containing protein n=1 Tax=Muraenolepis orangiensis TaxID=630683 RepID=A0A9Q0IRZ9_9TELE|nr:hypothetical protein NHX12_025160 [Muraenolepis orangiensis]